MSHVQSISSAAATASLPPSLIGQVTVEAPAKEHRGFTFHDFLNIFNPLQHIPVVSTLYREITGDTIKPISSILGGALFGGVVGLASSAVDAIVEETTGSDIGAHIMATLGLHHDRTAPKALAQTPPANAAPAAQAVSMSADQALQAIAAKYTAMNSKAGNPNMANMAQASAGMPALGLARPVPALLVAEAAADRANHAGSIGPAGSAKPGNPNAPAENQATSFFQSLQRGGNGTTRAAKETPLAVPPGVLSDGRTGGSRAAAVLATANAALANPPVTPLRPTASAVPPAGVADSAQAATPVAQAQANAPFQTSADGAAQPLPRQAIPGMMMEALAKYEAMHKAPQASSPQGSSVDQIH